MTRMSLSSLATVAVLAMAAGGGAVPADAAKAKRKAEDATGTAKGVQTEAITLTHEKLGPVKRSSKGARRSIHTPEWTNPRPGNAGTP